MVIWNCRGRAIIFFLESAREPAAAPGRFCFACGKRGRRRRARFPPRTPISRGWIEGMDMVVRPPRALRIIKRLLHAATTAVGRGSRRRRRGRGRVVDAEEQWRWPWPVHAH